VITRVIKAVEDQMEWDVQPEGQGGVGDDNNNMNDNLKSS
jgi:hypothetical protein